MKLPNEVRNGAFLACREDRLVEDAVRDCAKMLFDAAEAERCGGQTFLATLLREKGLATLARYELEKNDD